ncbi:19477_t:CDS:2 [Funneliformis geosporum]|uniref:19477_t:CDS:1 n=1 Tax=Funneliformis geosporum TaxID=1117311 RepID=A0A9W4SXH2_9GLOM|nr:19477_t:CDS:2 [Funneliformis geosporum]
MTKTLKPLTNSSRNTILIDYREKLTPKPPKTPRKLLCLLKPHSGRNNQGKITTRHQGGRHKRFYRIIDFKRYPNDNMEGEVKSIEYDPNRNAFISLIHYQKNNSFSFIITPEGLKKDDKIISGESKDIPIQVGNNLPLSCIPVNTPIHNIELKPKKGGQLMRSAGTYAEIIGKVGNDGRVPVKLGSKIEYKILANCRATIGKVSNTMNPVDHPHGGGEQKTGIGRPSPLSP